MRPADREVHRLPGGADQLGDLLLRNLHGHAIMTLERIPTCRPVPLGQGEQQACDPHLGRVVGNARGDIAHLAQPRAERGQHDGHGRRPVADPGQEPVGRHAQRVARLIGIGLDDLIGPR